MFLRSKMPIGRAEPSDRRLLRLEALSFRGSSDAAPRIAELANGVLRNTCFSFCNSSRCENDSIPMLVQRAYLRVRPNDVRSGWGISHSVSQTHAVSCGNALISFRNDGEDIICSVVESLCIDERFRFFGGGAVASQTLV